MVSRYRGNITLRAIDILVVMALLFISVVLEIILLEIGKDLNCKISIIVVFAMICYASLYLSARRREKRVSYFRIFLFISFFFYFGQHILVLINSGLLYSTTNNTILSGRVKDRYVVIGSFFILQSIVLLYLGYCVGKPYNPTRGRIECFGEIENADNIYIKKVFFAFLIISAIPAFVIAIYRMRLASQIGYSDLRDIDDTVYTTGGIFISICSYLQGWFLPSLYMMLIVERKKKRRHLYCVLIAYCVLYVMSGSRFTILKILVAIILIEYEWRMEIRTKDLARYGLILVGIGLVFSVIGRIRNMTASNFTDAFKSNLSSYPFDSILWETGITFHSVSNIIQHCPGDAPFIYGKSVLGAIFVCLPVFLRLNFVDVDALTTSKIFSPYFYGFVGVGYGSSFIAEGYHNFGYFFLAVVVIYGYVLGKMEFSAYNAIKKKDAYSFFIMVYAFSEFAYTIRTDLWAVPRSVLYYAIIPLLIVRYLKLKSY